MIDINKAKLNLLSSGFLNIHIDSNLDLFKISSGKNDKST